MTPIPLRIRILTALELQPMTIRQLSQCLSCYRESIDRWIYAYRKCGAVQCTPGHYNGRPANIWRVVR